MKSKTWVLRQKKDQFVKKAKQIGYINRAAFKLEEIEKKFKLIKHSKNIFEFGTCSGKTTYIMALNSSINSKIITLTLGPKEAEDLRIDNADNKVSYRNIINESIYKNFLFSGTEQENKIEVIFKNSLKFDEKIYEKTFDLIFIDGGHTYSIVKNDSEKAFKMIRKN